MIRARSHASPGNLRHGIAITSQAPGQAGQESRSSGHRGATSLITMDDITIHATFLPHDDPDASLAFYRDVLGFEVRNDVGYGGLRWITVGPPGQPSMSIAPHHRGNDGQRQLRLHHPGHQGP